MHESGVRAIHADITTVAADAVVDAANQHLAVFSRALTPAAPPAS